MTKRKLDNLTEWHDSKKSYGNALHQIDNFKLMRQALDPRSGNWVVYTILCSDKSLYTGITNNLKRRFNQHRKNQGAKYFRGRHALKVVYVEDGHNRSSASKREFAIKQLKTTEKLSLIASQANNVSNYKF